MAMELMARYRLPAADRAGSAHSADVPRHLGVTDRVEVNIVHSDGTTEHAEMPSAAANIVADILTALAQGPEVAVLVDDPEVSPEEAAAILGIPRHLVRRRMDAGLVPFRLRNLLVQLGVDHVVRPRWSDAFHDEWIGNLMTSGKSARDRLLRTRDIMKRVLSGADVTDYEHPRHVAGTDPRDEPEDVERSHRVSMFRAVSIKLERSHPAWPAHRARFAW